MKTVLLATLFGAFTICGGYCKSGGWFFDILDRSSLNINAGYCVQPQYYYQQPQVIYYQQQNVPVYYQSAPVYYFQPYQNNYYNRPRRYCH